MIDVSRYQSMHAWANHYKSSKDRYKITQQSLVLQLRGNCKNKIKTLHSKYQKFKSTEKIKKKKIQKTKNKKIGTFNKIHKTHNKKIPFFVHIRLITSILAKNNDNINRTQKVKREKVKALYQGREDGMKGERREWKKSGERWDPHERGDGGGGRKR